MMPFGLADTLSSTLDLPTFAKTVWITGREMVGNLLIGMWHIWSPCAVKADLSYRDHR